jgi:hypothetical protein
MRSLSRFFAGLALAAMLALTPASLTHAQPADADAFHQIMLETAGDDALLLSTIRSFASLPPENEQILLDHLRAVLSLREFSDYLFAEMGANALATGEEAFALGIGQGTEIAAAGIARLSAAEQAQFIAFSRFTMETAAAIDPVGCATAILDPEADPMLLARIDFAAYQVMSAKEMTAILGVYRAALAAELEQLPPANVATDAEVAEGARALNAAFEQIVVTSPIWQRIGAAADFGDVDPADLCLATGTIFDALDGLAEPQRSWAMIAILTDQL